jgi:hypothetical protein
MRLAGHVARMGENRNAYRVLLEKSVKITILEDLDVDDIEMVFLGMGWYCMMWIHLA